MFHSKNLLQFGPILRNIYSDLLHIYIDRALPQVIATYTESESTSSADTFIYHLSINLINKFILFQTDLAFYSSVI